MTVETFAQQLVEEYEANPDALMSEFKEKLLTENGYEPTLDWGDFIYTRVTQSHPSLDDDAIEAMTEEIRDIISV